MTSESFRQNERRPLKEGPLVKEELLEWVETTMARIAENDGATDEDLCDAFRNYLDAETAAKIIRAGFDSLMPPRALDDAPPVEVTSFGEEEPPYTPPLDDRFPGWYNDERYRTRFNLVLEQMLEGQEIEGEIKDRM